MIVKFLCRREQSTHAETGVGTAVTWRGSQRTQVHRAEGRRMRRKKIKMEENDMHRSEERVLEVDKNIVHNVSDLNTLMPALK